MIRSSRYACTLGLGIALVAGSSARPAYAIKQFFDEFKAVYVKDGSPLAAAVDSAKCNVCHVGSSKKDRNAYGEALAERLDKKEDAKNPEKIRMALDEVAKLPSPRNPADRAGRRSFGRTRSSQPLHANALQR
jgi:hypothetical protein